MTMKKTENMSEEYLEILTSSVRLRDILVKHISKRYAVSFPKYSSFGVAYTGRKEEILRVREFAAGFFTGVEAQ